MSQAISRQGNIWQRIKAVDWKQGLPLLLLVLLAAALWWLYAFQPFAGLSPDAFGDSYDYAQLARGIMRGSWREGITTYNVPPLALAVTGRVPFLNVIRAPLHPIVLALSFAIFGPWDRTIALTTGALFLLSVPVLYFTGRRIFGPATAFVATLVYILSDWVLQMSVSGLSEPLYIVLFLGMLLLAYESAQKPGSWLLPVLAGVAAGLAYLTRYNTILFVPLIAIYLFLAGRERRWLRAGSFAIVWGLVAAPWLLRNLYFFGSPTFSMQQWTTIMFTPSHPRFSLWKDAFPPAVRASVLGNLPEMAAKIKTTMLDFYHGIPRDVSFNGGNPFTILLFFASLFWPLEKKQSALRWLILAMAGVQILSLSILHYIPRLLFPFYPLFLLFGVHFLISRLEEWTQRLEAPRARQWVTVLILAVSVFLLTLPTLNNVPDAMRQGFYPRLLPVRNLEEYGQAMRYIQQTTEPDAVLMSDHMDIVSWYGDRATVWVPTSLEMVAELETYTPIEGIYLTSRMFRWPEDQAWYSIYETQPNSILEGRYLLEKVFANGSLFYRQTQ